MTILTENLILAAHLPRHLRALLHGEEEFKNVAGLKAADGIREQLLSGSPDFLRRVESARQPDPWLFGFAVIHKRDLVLIGTGGFPGPPDSAGVAEIAYGIAPAYQGKGYATELARALIDFASADARVTTIRAHTLAAPNPSTSVLKKCGLRRSRDAVDPESGITVWRWEKRVKR